MAFKYIALTSIDLATEGTFVKGDLSKAVFQSPCSAWPYSDKQLFTQVEIQDIRKNGIYQAELDHDTGAVDLNGNPILESRLVVNQDLLVSRISVEKNRLDGLLVSCYEAQMQALAVKHISLAERDSFSAKLEAAKLWKALTDEEKDLRIAEFMNDPSQFEVLIILLEEVEFSEGESPQVWRTLVDTLSSTILANSFAWKQLIGKLTKKRKALWKEIDSVPETEQGLDTLLDFDVPSRMAL